MSESKSSYGNIFKTTFLFGFVQLFKVAIGVVSNKIAAMFIGAEGIGTLGIYNTTIQMIQTGAGLGVNQSAVRDISEANGSNDRTKISYIISVTNKIILYTGLLGCVVTLALSFFLSNWTFGDSAHIISYCILSIVVALNIINESKQAILKGTRQLKSLANASLIGSTMGLFVSAPLYFFIGRDGIIPVMLIAAIVAVLVSNHYVNRISYERVDLNLRQTMTSAKPMVKMGIALMSMTLLQTIVAFVINSFIRSKGGLVDVGYFSAGITITGSYFGVIITALMTDYYPRIAAVNKDNKALQNELNNQSIVSLILCCPMFVLFMTLLPFFVKILYTDSFLPTVDFVKWSIYWTLITVCSNQVDLILVAKFETKVFLTISVFFRIIQVALCTLLYNFWGIEGLGIAYFILGIIHASIMCTTVYCLYHIHYDWKFIKYGSVVLLFVVASSLVQNLSTGATLYIMTAIVFTLSVVFSYITTQKLLGVKIVSIIKSKIKK